MLRSVHLALAKNVYIPRTYLYREGFNLPFDKTGVGLVYVNPSSSVDSRAKPVGQLSAKHRSLFLQPSGPLLVKCLSNLASKFLSSPCK